jgi:hypothetical protein
MKTREIKTRRDQPLTVAEGEKRGKTGQKNCSNPTLTNNYTT